MNYLWRVNIDTAIEWFEFQKDLEKEMGKELSRKELEFAFNEFMKSKNIKPSGATELTKDELLKEIVSKSKTILNIDEKGIRIIKKKEENND